MRSLALALALLADCSPAYYGATKKCPTTTMVVTDFVTSALVLTLAGLHWSGERYLRSSLEGVGAVGLWTATNYAEVKCVR